METARKLVGDIEQSEEESNRITEFIWKLERRVEKARANIALTEKQLPELFARKFLAEVKPATVKFQVDWLRSEQNTAWEHEQTLEHLHKLVVRARNVSQSAREKITNTFNRLIAQAEETGTCTDPATLLAVAGFSGHRAHPGIAEELIARLGEKNAA